MDGKNETILNLFMNKHSLQWVWNSESDEDNKKIERKMIWEYLNKNQTSKQ